MNGFDGEIDILLNLDRPSPNAKTDNFGFGRHWGEDTWHPWAGYSPIHAGVDYTAQGDSQVYAPCDLYAWGAYKSGHVGSYIMMRPIKSDGEAAKHIALYFFHCEPTKGGWVRYDKGEPMTTQAGYGVGAPHLHFEIAATTPMGMELVQQGVIDDRWITERNWRRKATATGVDPDLAMVEIREQMNAWNIRGMYYDYFIRAAIPEYKKSIHSTVGKAGYTYILAPHIFT